MFGFAVFLILVVIMSIFLRNKIHDLFRITHTMGRDRFGNDVKVPVPDDAELQYHEGYKIVNAARGVFIFVAALLIFGSAWTVVDSQEFGVVQQWGSDKGTLDEGWTLVLPWRDVHTFDARVQTIEYTKVNSNAISGRVGDAAAVATGEEVDLANAFGTYTADIALRAQLVNEQGAQRVFDEYDTLDNFLQNAARNDTRSVIRSQFESYGLLSLDAQRDTLASESCDALTAAWADIGVICVEIDIRGIDIDDQIEQAAKDVVDARLAAEQAVFTVVKATELAQIEVIEAQAAFDAQQIFECGYTEIEDEDGNTSRVPNSRDEEGGGCDDVLSDRGLYVRCLAGRTGAVDGAQANEFIVPPDCESILTGERNSNPLGGAEVLVSP